MSTDYTLDEIRTRLLKKAEQRANPVFFLTPQILADAMAPLEDDSRDSWGAAFLTAARPFERRAAGGEAAGDKPAAISDWQIAYNLCQIGRYPAPNSPGKQRSYEQARRNHARLLALIDPSAELVQMPFKARPGEGAFVPAVLRKPTQNAGGAWPVIVTWGGVDTYKEERSVLTEPYLRAGFAILAIDMPGTGQAPLVGSLDAERLWDDVLDWIAARSDLDSCKVAIHGLSTGGYWATKVAHTHAGRIRAAINQGGCAHFAFQLNWIAAMAAGEYPFELAETLAAAWGLQTRDEWLKFAPRLSLRDQGILDRPCAPMLLINGTADSIFPIADMYLLLEHGNPKAARFYEGFGHMGPGAKTTPTMIDWLRRALDVKTVNS